MDQEITARQGERVEIRLPATNRWSVTMRTDDGVLQPIEPQGEIDEQRNERVWHYLAALPGNAVLMFAGRGIPHPGRKTPHFVIGRTYSVTVTP